MHHLAGPMELDPGCSWRAPARNNAMSTWLLAACGSGAGRVGGRDDDAYLPQLRWPPLSGRGHQPRGLAVLPLPAQPAHGRGDAGRPQHHRQPQDHTAIGAQVRPELHQPRRRLPCAGDKWHLDELAIKIAGKKHWVWRAVDQEGFVLDILVQSRRDKWAAKRLLHKLLKRHCRAPRVMITDKLASYGAALFHGDFTIDRKAINFEASIRDDKTYTYFGV